MGLLYGGHINKEGDVNEKNNIQIKKDHSDNPVTVYNGFFQFLH